MLSEEKINDKKYFYSVQLFDPKNADLIIELKPPRQCLDGLYMSVVGVDDCCNGYFTRP